MKQDMIDAQDGDLNYVEPDDEFAFFYGLLSALALTALALTAVSLTALAFVLWAVLS